MRKYVGLQQDISEKKVNVTETFKAQAKSQMEFNEAPNGQINIIP